jgi:serine/threonine protein phosphatase PrpC
MFGVCDGHGHFGKEASGLVKQVLPGQLETCSNYTDAFLNTDAALNKSVETNLSGTTVVVVIFEGTKVICLNAGDSRAIKVSLNEQSYGQLYPEATALSEDHKPELDVERDRILMTGGRIQAFKDE